VRFTRFSISGFLALSLTLPACSSGNSSVTPGGSALTPTARQSIEIKITVFHKAHTSECHPSLYYACVYIAPGSSGPYVEFSACTGKTCSSQYDMVGKQDYYSIKTGKPSKDLSLAWSPDPGNPTDQRITEVKTQKPSKYVQFMDSVSECYSRYPSQCTRSYNIGLIPH